MEEPVGKVTPYTSGKGDLALGKGLLKLKSVRKTLSGDTDALRSETSIFFLKP